MSEFKTEKCEDSKKEDKQESKQESKQEGKKEEGREDKNLKKPWIRRNPERAGEAGSYG